MCSLNFDICGDYGVGKTSLISRFTEGAYRGSYHGTTGVHMGIRKVRLDNRPISLYLWDSVMYKRPDSYPSSNFRTLDGIVFVLDCTRKESIDVILEWQKKLEDEEQTHIPKLLLSNKCDLVSERVISEKSADRLAKQFNLKYFEVSAKNSTQVEEAFLTLAAYAVNNINSGLTR